MFFYALHPFVVRHALALKMVGLSLGTGAVLAAMFIVTRWSPEWFSMEIVGWLLYISPLFRVGEFLLGIALAAAIKRGFRIPFGVIPAAVLVGLFFHLRYVVSPTYFSVELDILVAQLSYAVLPVLYAALIAAAAQLDLSGARSVLRLRPMQLLGQWSYALYLIHATIIYFLIETIGVRSYSALNVLWFGFVTALCVGASALLYAFLEHPVEQRLRRALKPTRAGPESDMGVRAGADAGVGVPDGRG
jgi:peptidoglycan/LPS O-acetylase OafA/YrhL